MTPRDACRRYATVDSWTRQAQHSRRRLDDVVDATLVALALACFLAMAWFGGMFQS